MKKREMLWNALQAAFPHTLPIMTGFLFLGTAYGIYMSASGFNFIYPMLMSTFIYGGSLEFLAVGLLQESFAPLKTLLLAFVLQARHLFYGIAMLQRYQNVGRKKYYLIFGMSDESFSVNYSADIPLCVDRGWFMFFVTLLNQCYWIFGATLGGLFGSLISFNTAGIEFVMTAMFVVIFLEQWLKEKQHISSLIGIAATLACRIFWGKEVFLLPSMLCILGSLTILRGTIEKRGEEGE